MALVGTNGQGVGTSVFHQWAINCKKHLSPDQMEIFDQFIENAYDAMEEGNFCIFKNICYALIVVSVNRIIVFYFYVIHKYFHMFYKMYLTFK